MITRQKYQSCCGSNGFVFIMDKPIRKSQMHLFIELGYTVPDDYLNNGIFFVQKEYLVSNAAFGSTKVTVRCNGKNCATLINKFQEDLEKAINSI